MRDTAQAWPSAILTTSPWSCSRHRRDCPCCLGLPRAGGGPRRRRAGYVGSAMPADEKPRKMLRHIARCDRCGTTIESMHPWDVVSCECGSLEISGGIFRPHVSWMASAGGAWSDLSEYEGEDVDSPADDDPPVDEDA